MNSQIEFQMWNPACLLKAALGDALPSLTQFAREHPSLEALFEAVNFVEEVTGLEIEARLERNSIGAPTVLRRSPKNEYSHNVTIEGDAYIDHWMYHADMGSSTYTTLENVVLAFCVPKRNDVDILVTKIGIERARHCLNTVSYSKGSGLKIT